MSFMSGDDDASNLVIEYAQNAVKIFDSNPLAVKGFLINDYTLGLYIVFDGHPFNQRVSSKIMQYVFTFNETRPNPDSLEISINQTFIPLTCDSLAINRFKVTAIKYLEGRLIIGLKDMGLLIYDTFNLRVLKLEKIQSIIAHDQLEILHISSSNTFSFSVLTANLGVIIVDYPNATEAGLLDKPIVSETSGKGTVLSKDLHAEYVDGQFGYLQTMDNGELHVKIFACNMLRHSKDLASFPISQKWKSCISMQIINSEHFAK